MWILLVLGCTAPPPGGTGDTAEPPRAWAGATAPTWRPTGIERPDVDVLVIGAGPSGLAAAGEALRAGATVQVLEREGAIGGAAPWGGSLMLYSGTPQQEAAGVADSPEQLLAEWPEFTGGDPDDPWVRYFAEANVPEVYDYLIDLGVTFRPPFADASAGETARIHEVEGGGAALIRALAQQVPPEDVRLGIEAVDLLIEGGQVVGVSWTDRATGEAGETTARAVVLATGGFMHDLERVQLERPDLGEDLLLYDSWTGDDGNGLRMLEGHGAAVQNLQAIGLYAHSTPDPADTGDGLPIPYASRAIWLNLDGDRFADEGDSNSFFVGQSLADQRSGRAWVVSDADTASGVTFGFPDHGSSYSMDELLSLGVAWEAKDLAALAVPLDLDPDAVVATAAAYNAFVTGGSADPFRTDPARADALDHPPYYAVGMGVGVAKGFGGIDVDLAGRVLGADGAILPGAFACGELTGMAGGSLVGDYGFTGSLTAVVLSGRVAGAAAAGR